MGRGRVSHLTRRVVHRPHRSSRCSVTRTKGHGLGACSAFRVAFRFFSLPRRDGTFGLRRRASWTWMRLGCGGPPLGSRGCRRCGTGLPVSRLRNDPGYVLKCFLSHHVAGAGPSYTTADANAAMGPRCGEQADRDNMDRSTKNRTRLVMELWKLGRGELCTICRYGLKGLSKGNYGSSQHVTMKAILGIWRCRRVLHREGGRVAEWPSGREADCNCRLQTADWRVGECFDCRLSR